MFVVSGVLLSWIYMQWTHEAGHVLGGLASGGRIERVVLDPIAFSRTDVVGSRSPLITIWSGPVLGIVIGAGLALAVAHIAHVAKEAGMFVAGACALANGTYIGIGPFVPVGDTADMLAHGSPRWLMLAFGLIAFVAGRALVVRAMSGVGGPRPSYAVVVVMLFAALGLALVGRVWFPAS